MSYVWRKLECSFGHRFERLMEKGSQPPDDCPICEAVLEVLPAPHERTDARSDTQGAPLIRSDRARAIQHFEEIAFRRPHFDDGKPLLTNLRDNTREGEVAAVAETPSTNETMRFMRDQIAANAAGGPKAETPNGAQMAAIGGGWGSVSGANLSGMGVQNTLGRPVVDLQAKRGAAK